jgi:hemoglobin-like flavoprotein
MPTPTQITVVQESFAAVAPIAADAADLFYQRLFTLDPSLRPLFPDDLEEQKRKLMQMLGLAVKGLNQPERLVPVLEDLGRRHGTYGVKDEHYDVVGEALLWTLAKGLGDAFTLEVEEAWLEVYGLIASTMKDAANQPTPVG